MIMHYGKEGEGMNSKHRKRKRSAEDWLVDGIAYGFALILMVSILVPFKIGRAHV